MTPAVLRSFVSGIGGEGGGGEWGRLFVSQRGGKEKRQRRLSLSLPFFGKKKSASKASPILLLPCFSHAQSEESLKKGREIFRCPPNGHLGGEKINETFVSPPRLWPTLTVGKTKHDFS